MLKGIVLPMLLSITFLMTGCFGGSSGSSDESPERALASVAGYDLIVEVGKSVDLDGTESIKASRDEIVGWRWFVLPSSFADLGDSESPETTLNVSDNAVPGRSIEVFLEVRNEAGVRAQDSFFVSIADPDIPDADLSDSEEPLLFFSEVGPLVDGFSDLEIRAKEIHAVDPSDPGFDRTAEIDTLATHNARSRLDKPDDTAGKRGGNEYGPDEITLPLGVLEVEESEGVLEVKGRHAVVFNTPGGHLKRVPAQGGLSDSERISSESEAAVVCTARVLTDYQDVSDSILAYQYSVSGDCVGRPTTWRAVRIDDDGTTDPIDLIGDQTVTYADFEVGLSPEWVNPVRDSEGSITDLIVYRGNNNFSSESGNNTSGDLLRVDLKNGDRTALEPSQADLTSDPITDDSIEVFRKLASIDGKQFLFNMAFSGQGAPRFTFLYDSEDDSFQFVENRVTGQPLELAARPIGPDQTLKVDDAWFVADIVDSSAHSGRLVKIEPGADPVPTFSLVDDDWGSGRVPASFVTDGDDIAWTYAEAGRTDDLEDVWSYRVFERSQNAGTSRIQNQDLLFFDGFEGPIDSPTAPEGRLYFNSNTRNAASAESMSNPQSSESLPNSILVGQSWKTEIQPTGVEADWVFFLEPSSGTGDDFAAATATDFEDKVSFNNSPAGGRQDSAMTVLGYGDELLLGWQRGIDTQVYFVNPATEELQPLSTLGAIAAPIPFVH